MKKGDRIIIDMSVEGSKFKGLKGTIENITLACDTYLGTDDMVEVILDDMTLFDNKEDTVKMALKNVKPLNDKFICLSCNKTGTKEELHKSKIVEDYLDGHCCVGDIIEYDYMKRLRLRELKALQDLIYGDCMREDRTIKDVEDCADIMRKTFNIIFQHEGTI